MRFIREGIRFLKFYINAQTIHNVHPPHAFDLLEKTIENEGDYYALGQLLYVRHILLSDQRLIGGHKVSELYANQLVKEADCNFIFKLSLFLKARCVLVIAEPLSLIALYIAKANKSTKVYIPVADEQIATLATSLCADLKINNVQLIQADKASIALKDKIYDLVYYDNTCKLTELVTKDILSSILDKENSTLVSTSKINTDSLYPSIHDKKPILSLELQNLFLMIRSDHLLKSQYYRIIKKKYKPWKLGLWAI